MRFLTTLLILIPGQFVLASDLPDRELARYIDDRVESGEYIGMIVGYFDASNSYVQAFGSISKSAQVRPDELTIFEISSVAKTFVVTILADAVTRGDMALDDPVNRYLPADAQLASFEGKEITLLDLAAHQSGLPNFPESLPSDDSINPRAGSTTEDLLESVRSFVPTEPPGGGYRYSGFAYAVLAHALSGALGEPFPSLVDSRLTKPLGMNDTVLQLSADQQARLATGYTREGAPALPLDQGVFRPAGSMYSTLADLMTWTQLHAGNIQSPLTAAAKLTHEIRNDAGTVALAWHRTAGRDDRSQFGTANGYRAYVGFLADGSKGAVVLANTIVNVQAIGDRLLFGAEMPE